MFKAWPTLALGVAVLLILGLFAWRLLQSPEEEAAPSAPTARITVAPVLAGVIGQTVEAYGVVAGSPTGTRTLSAPREAIVRDLLATPGQGVAAGTPLMVIGDTPASGLAHRQALDASAFAAEELTRVQRLYDEHLAASDQLTAARRGVADAQAGLAAQAAAGGGGARQTLVSPVTGVVWQVSATRGQQVAAGTSLLTIVASGGLLAQLGVEPGYAKSLAVGQAARIASALDPSVTTRSRLTVVGRAVDPTSHMVTVIAPVQDTSLALGAAVKAEITLASSPGLTVPAASVVHDEDGTHVFVIAMGKARRVAVTTGALESDQVVVTGAIRAGDQVAVDGAYQLQDGMAVRVAEQ